MHKHSVHILVLSVLVLFLAGCTAAPAAPTAVPTEPAAPVEHTLPAVTQPIIATEAPIPADSPEPAVTEETGSALPYQVRIDQCLHQGPGYFYEVVDTVPVRGTFTVVEEFLDYEGYLWGKLESGIGWVDLTNIPAEHDALPLITANFADVYLLLETEHHLCPSDEDYSIPVAFHAYGKLRDVTLFEIRFNAEGYVPGADFFTLPEMTEEMPLVAELTFPGDMSMYGIRFLDEAGNVHAYSIYISGRNGALVLNAEDQWVP